MFHKNVASSLRSGTTLVSSVAPLTRADGQAVEHTPSARLTLVPAGAAQHSPATSLLRDFVLIAAPRCSAFLAEAAVLVLVLALLDRFMLKGRMEIGWAVSAFAISLGLLGASIATEWVARRWLRVQGGPGTHPH